MGISEIAKALKAQVREWQLRITVKDSKLTTPHPSEIILQLLEQAYHSSDFLRELDARYKEVCAEVGSIILEWPSLE